MFAAEGEDTVAVVEEDTVVVVEDVVAIWVISDALWADVPAVNDRVLAAGV